MVYQEPYLPLDSSGVADTGGPPSSTREFLMRCLLGAREETGFPSNTAFYDEDVNVYVVGLLERFFSPAYHEQIRRYLHRSDLDLAQEVRRQRDDRHTYRLYRTNADHLLLAIGLFHHVEGTQHPNPLLERDPSTFIGRGGTYYHLASSSLRRLRRQTSGPEVVMTKLGTSFGDYTEVLKRVRTSYFHLTARLGEGVLYHLAGVEPADPTTASERYDGFLDAFSAWKQGETLQRWEELHEAVQKVREIDADFGFQLPDRPDGENISNS